MPKKKTSIQLSEEAKRLQKLLAEVLGINQTAVMELAIRELADRKGIK